MKDKPGYQLPAEGADTEETQCVLVFYPDKEEYRRALFGSLSYLGTWLAWELDDEKRGRQAAQAWKNANDLTLECWNMACLEQLQADVAAIRALLASANYCCDGTTTISPPPPVTTEIIPGDGDPPEYYGETEITSWEDWEAHVCYNANKWVDDLVATAATLNTFSQDGILTLAIVSAGLALLAFSGVGIPIAISVAIAALSAITAGGALIFADTAQDIEDARDDIVCALLTGGDVESVINDALGEASLDYTSFFQHIPYDQTTAIIYEGGANGEYLPAETSDDCDCEPDYGEYQSPYHTGDAGDLSFMSNNGWTFGSTIGNPAHPPGSDNYGWRKPYSNQSGSADASCTNVRLETGLSGGYNATLTVNRVRFDLMRTVSGAPAIKVTIGSHVQTIYGAAADGVWRTQTIVLDPPQYISPPGSTSAVKFEISGGNAGYCHFDNVIIDFDTDIE
jgi:hypothetical protein